jgi:AcrR family transcriptional regulator
MVEPRMRVTSETKTATRKRILEVAQEQFARHGFEATTTRDVAAAAGIAAGTLFNYFPTKEAIVECLVSEAYAKVAEKFAEAPSQEEPPSLEEELFAHVATALRKLSPYRKYVPAVLETALSPLALSPLATDGDGEAGPLRLLHLETVVKIATRHGRREAFSTIAMQMYWTLFTGVLAFWARDTSPKQENTLALLDQSLAMFAGWLESEPGATTKGGKPCP